MNENAITIACLTLKQPQYVTHLTTSTEKQIDKCYQDNLIFIKKKYTQLDKEKATISVEGQRIDNKQDNI